MKVNPLKWAAIGCVLCALIATLANLVGTPMPSTVEEAAMGGLFWGWLMAILRNRTAH